MALDYASIGLRIKHARTQMKMTQSQLAEIIGISRTHLGLLESGERGISLELLIGISNALKVPVSDLLIDNISGVDGVDDDEIHYILLDCNAQEESIITKAAKSLKSILIEHGL